jgi:hypothetical protein
MSEILVLETANVSDEDDYDYITYFKKAKSLKTANRHEVGVKV